METPVRPIVIRDGSTGETFEWNPPDALWLDMLAFCRVRDLTIEELIRKALTDFFRLRES